MVKQRSEPTPVGFWRSKLQPDLPKAQARKEPAVQQPQILAGLLYAESTARQTLYRGWSTCRICGRPNGNGEYIHGGYVWPSGLRHYIVEHNVRLPAPFVTYLLQLVKKKRLQPIEPIKPEIVVIDSKIWDKLLRLSRLDPTRDTVETDRAMFARLIRQAERQRTMAKGGG